MTEKQTDPYAHELEMQRKREEWFAEKKRAAEAAERRQKQAELEAYLTRRGRDHLDHTGEQPTPDDLATWRREYMDKIEGEYQDEREAKLRAAEEHYNF